MAPAAKEFYEDQKNLNKLCNFLRGADGPAVREAIMMDKRVYYIKGEKLVNFMVEPKKGNKMAQGITPIFISPRCHCCMQGAVQHSIHSSI